MVGSSGEHGDGALRFRLQKKGISVTIWGFASFWRRKMLDKGDNFELDKAVEWLTFSFFSGMSGVRFSTRKLPKLRETLWISSVPPDKLHVSILKQAKTTSSPLYKFIIHYPHT